MNGKAEESGICNELWTNKLIVISSPNEKRPRLLKSNFI